MKRVHCIVEDPTEVGVFSSILAPYILEKTGAYIFFIPIKHTKGGMVHFSKIFTELRSHLKEKNKVVTTFFDYYGILPKYGFYKYKEAKLQQKNARIGVELLEKGMVEYLKEKNVNTHNFIPYIQLHEFEALLFSSDDGFEFMYDNPSVLKEFKNVRNRFPNPEDINDSPHTSPSHRIINELKAKGDKYIEKADGENIATYIGIDVMLENCPRFAKWVENLINKIDSI